ncbi:MAG: hypothetical protein ACYS7Y_25335, partial [Planctomycetota bacterium]
MNKNKPIGSKTLTAIAGYNLPTKPPTVKLEPEFEVVEPLIDVSDPQSDFGALLQDVEVPEEVVEEKEPDEALSRYVDYPVKLTEPIATEDDEDEEVDDVAVDDEEEDVEPEPDEDDEEEDAIEQA